jgi:L-seryl-tRNA(Ser) seleniumtransferase
LYRALRADKLSLAVLGKTLEAHRREAALKEVPVLRMLALTKLEISERARALLETYSQRSTSSDLIFEIRDGESAIGGGAGANTHPTTALITVSHQQWPADQLAQALRTSQPPVICRIADGKVVIDLRTVAREEEPEILQAMLALSK